MNYSFQSFYLFFRVLSYPIKLVVGQTFLQKSNMVDCLLNNVMFILVHLNEYYVLMLLTLIIYYQDFVIQIQHCAQSMKSKMSFAYCLMLEVSEDHIMDLIYVSQRRILSEELLVFLLSLNNFGCYQVIGIYCSSACCFPFQLIKLYCQSYINQFIHSENVYQSRFTELKKFDGISESIIYDFLQFFDFIIIQIMGNSQAQQNIQYHSDNLQQFNLSHYGGKVLVDKSNKIVYKDFVIYPHEQEQFQHLLNARIRLKHPNLAEITNVQILQADDSDFCTVNSTRYRLVYHLYAYSLFNQIQNCCKIRKPLPEAEVCRIFHDVVSCLQYLQSMNTLHGDIKVSNIFMDKQRNVKLIDSFFLKQGKTSYEVVLEDPKSMSLLAPEQLDLLKVKLFDTLSLSIHKEMFAVGMCMIEATTIQQGMRCYDLDSLKIKDQFFIYMMQHIQSCGYSRELSNLIMNCVHKNPKKRPSYSVFLKTIQQLMNTFRYVSK